VVYIAWSALIGWSDANDSCKYNFIMHTPVPALGSQVVQVLRGKGALSGLIEHQLMPMVPAALGGFNGTGVTKEDKSARHSVMAHFME
jgi:hypothetical protein